MKRIQRPCLQPKQVKTGWKWQKGRTDKSPHWGLSKNSACTACALRILRVPERDITSGSERFSIRRQVAPFYIERDDGGVGRGQEEFLAVVERLGIASDFQLMPLPGATEPCDSVRFYLRKGSRDNGDEEIVPGNRNHAEVQVQVHYLPVLFMIFRVCHLYYYLINLCYSYTHGDFLLLSGRRCLLNGIDCIRQVALFCWKLYTQQIS